MKLVYKNYILNTDSRRILFKQKIIIKANSKTVCKWCLRRKNCFSYVIGNESRGMCRFWRCL